MKNLRKCMECFVWYEMGVEEVKSHHNNVAGLCEKEGGR